MKVIKPYPLNTELQICLLLHRKDVAESRKFWHEEADVLRKKNIEEKQDRKLTFGEIELERKYKLFKTIKWHGKRKRRLCFTSSFNKPC